jgi:anti-sigma regulatory factor (Ser/Thr protein kinase)
VSGETQGGWVEQADTFRHEALLYAGEDEFVGATSSFVRAGLAAGEPTLVVVDARKIDRLREALDEDAEAVYFADMGSVGRNPARIIPAWREFVARHAAAGARLRGVGEPIVPGHGPDELVECQRHESLLNLAFADTRSFWLLCPYDTEALEPAVVDEARRSHPFVAHADARAESAEYEGLDAVAAPFAVPLPEPAGDAAELPFEEGALEALRRVVVEHATRAGLGRGRIVDLLVAVEEIVSDSLRHRGGRGVLRIWPQGRRVVCEISDGGRLDDPLADRVLPSPGSASGRGLWIANRLCDLVQIRSFPTGTVVRLHMACA